MELKKRETLLLTEAPAGALKKARAQNIPKDLLTADNGWFAMDGTQFV